MHKFIKGEYQNNQENILFYTLYNTAMASEKLDYMLKKRIFAIIQLPSWSDK